MKNTITAILIVAALYIFSSCQKVIMPNLTNISPQLVIEGAISDTIGPYYVHIFKSVNFNTDNIYPGVSGATVSITDVTSGASDILTEKSPGVYSTQTIEGIPGDTYQLKVLLDGKTYLAMSTMPKQVLLDSVTFDYSDKSMTQPIAGYQDPVNFTNYYKFSIQVNGVNLQRFQTFEDLLSNGKYIRSKLAIDSGVIKQNDTVRVSLVGVDQNLYHFLREAEVVAYFNDSLATPATPDSNISGGCLGYFSAQTVSNKTAVAKY